MVTSSQRGAFRSSRLAGLALALSAVLPLAAACFWSGWRLATSDLLLAVLTPLEAPLSIRTPAGVWAFGLALVWLSLARRSRDAQAWEMALVVLGGAIALVRLGNVWLYGLAMVAPLARQVHLAELPRRVAAPVGALCLATAALVLMLGRPRGVPDAALQALAPDAHVLAEWRWADAARQHLGAQARVLPQPSEPDEFWVDYLRVAQGHERWSDILRRFEIDTLVVDPVDQSALARLVRGSPDWQVAYDDGGALVARRTAG